MARQLIELRKLKHFFRCPVLCAGDIFDKWNCSPELINFAIQYLPEGMVSIPGQHDLPHHREDLLHKSAYQTLLGAGVLHHLSTDAVVGGMHIVPFHWRRPLCSYDEAMIHRDVLPKCKVKVAIGHRYIHNAANMIPSASAIAESDDVDTAFASLAGFNVALFGDNHQGFVDAAILNCGGFYRRTTAQEKYAPRVGLLVRDESEHVQWWNWYLDVSKDVLTPNDLKESPDIDFDGRELIEELTNADRDDLDFVHAVQETVRSMNIPTPVRAFIRKLLEDV